jgi:hypothetical protein
MSSKEGIPLQQDMFSGDWKDTRTRGQQKADRERNKPQQSSMFAFGETYEFGASYRPWLKESPAGNLQLEREDIRTPDEIERDLIREANSQTTAMFEAEEPLPEIALVKSHTPTKVVPDQRVVGYRKRARQELALELRRNAAKPR